VRTSELRIILKEEQKFCVCGSSDQFVSLVNLAVQLISMPYPGIIGYLLVSYLHFVHQGMSFWLDILLLNGMLNINSQSSLFLSKLLPLYWFAIHVKEESLTQHMCDIIQQQLSHLGPTFMKSEKL